MATAASSQRNSARTAPRESSILVLVSLLVSTACAQDISTIAGDGHDSYNGDGIPATLAHLFQPDSVAVDVAGSVYINDDGHVRVRKVLPNGTIMTFAGTGVRGYNGDGIAATLAQLDASTYITVDTMGNVFIADADNHRIRKVLVNGTITTFAGTGHAPPYNGDWIPASLASLNGPTGVSSDGTTGDVYIGDLRNERIRKVFASNGTICTVAGYGVEGYNGDGIPSTSAQLHSARTAVVDRVGNVYIADVLNHRVRLVLPNGTITTFAGDGQGGYNGDGIPASRSRVNCPNDVALGNHGSILIADTCNDRVRRVFANGTIVTIAGTGERGYNGDGIPATTAALAAPSGVFEDDRGRVYIADTLNNRVRVVAAPTAPAQPQPAVPDVRLRVSK